jgi:shikimate 5-dehydrogenase
MLKQENIEITITNRNRSYFQNLKYEIEENKLTIKTTDLPKSSHQVVDVVCDLCHKEYPLRYDKYI